MSLTSEQGKQACDRFMGLKIGSGPRFDGHCSINDGFTCVADVYDSQSVTGLEAAKLFVAAPTMLDALLDLKGMERHITDQALRAKFVDRVYSAIDKATK